MFSNGNVYKLNRAALLQSNSNKLLHTPLLNNDWYCLTTWETLSISPNVVGCPLVINPIYCSLVRVIPERIFSLSRKVRNPCVRNVSLVQRSEYSQAVIIFIKLGDDHLVFLSKVCNASSKHHSVTELLICKE